MMPRPQRSGAAITRRVCLTECKLLLRDRRAFLLAIVLPMLLFPLLFLGMDALKRGSQQSQQETQLVVLHDLDRLGPAAKTSVLVELSREALHLKLEESEPTELAQSPPWSLRTHGGAKDPEPWRADAERRLEQADALLVARDELRDDGAFESLHMGLRLVFDGSKTQSNEARRRVQGALETLRERLLLEGLESDLGQDPGAVLVLEPKDMASAESASGHKLGGMLPIILVLIVISSASFAALGAFAGEREGGTIETLLVQPVPAAAVARGKFLAVLLVACLAAVGNGLSFWVSLLLGIGAESEGMQLGASGLRMGLGLLHFLPTAVLLSALLTLVSARARSFREGQHYVLPIVLLASLLASVSTQDSVSSNWLFALVPIAGPTLALRDTLAGQLAAGPALLAFLASCAWSWWLLRRLANTLDAERLFKNPETSQEAALRQGSSRRALRLGFISVALVYIVGGRLQSAAVIPGLIATLWVLLPALALWCARGNAKASGQSLRASVGLVAVAPLHLLGALLLSPALVVLLGQLLSWQSRLLPMPQGISVPAELLELSPWVLVLLAAVSPGITEELLFRGAILGGLKRDLGVGKMVFWQALLFGAVHASIYRFLGTALLGALFTLVTLRARSLWPAMLLHACYNAIQLLDLPLSGWWHPGLALGLGALGALLLLATPPATRRGA